MFVVRSIASSIFKFKVKTPNNFLVNKSYYSVYYSTANMISTDNSTGSKVIETCNEVVKSSNLITTDGIYATGRRKTSIARVWIKEGSGQFIVNGKNIIDYFQPIQREHSIEPFLASNTSGLFDVWCTVKGGGISGQAGAVRLGISRALNSYDSNYKPSLKRAGLMTRDSRRVERKKPGQKKARKQYQWVKR